MTIQKEVKKSQLKLSKLSERDYCTKRQGSYVPRLYWRFLLLEGKRTCDFAFVSLRYGRSGEEICTGYAMAASGRMQYDYKQTNHVCTVFKDKFVARLRPRMYISAGIRQFHVMHHAQR